jgi:predicted phosphodiesterase
VGVISDTHGFLPTAAMEVFKDADLIIHDVYKINVKPSKLEISAVVHGHTHQASTIEDHHGVLFLNPGSATHPRFNSSTSVALLHIKGKSLTAQLIEI